MAGDLPSPRRARVAAEGLDAWRECFRVIQAFEIWGIYGEFIERRRPRLGPGIRERLAFAAKVSHHEAEEARKLRARARDQVRRLAKPGTILALPTAPGVAPRVDVPTEALEPFRANVMRLTCIAGLSGLPQVTIPIGTVSGCPVGLSFLGWAGSDEVLLDLAVRLSRHCGLHG
jgi:amidase